jgi:tryptophanyl-tRNA synthetase
MAADILAYKATHVPVGEDQKQHLELTRDIAQSFNSTYGVDFFPLPEPQIFGSATRVMSLRDGTKKMSKSDESDYSRINMTDGADEIAQKIRKARTDPDPLPESTDGLAERPEALNLVSIYAALEDIELDQVIQEYQGQGFSIFKKALADLAVVRLGPVGNEMKRLTAESGEIDKVLADGAERAVQLSGPIVAEVREIMGFLNPKKL